MTTARRRPLYYTFGNHMHWVDMQWLWGYGVLPDSIRDTLALCDATGARGNVNFDGVGYEKLAAEAPDALDELRAAVRDGRVEIVGASYGQPYGPFHGGESNVRQRVLGVRAVVRLLGVRPRSYWEEEFDCFPQLPQMLTGCGFRGASLFYQWTWHTPHVPEEQVPLVQWEGIDGTRLPAVARTALCLHQWPEDFDGRLDSEALRAMPRPALVQWLELMPSPDWMCRSEVLLPRLRELLADERFEVRPVTLAALIEALDDGDAPARAYGPDDLFHGVSLGKNGDRMPRMSHAAEAQLLAAEALASTCGLLGRPYPSWDVYPSWELDEAWRELLAAQHHDNHECEGLCGSVGVRSFERALALGGDALGRCRDLLVRRAPIEEGLVLCNPLGWARTADLVRLGPVEVPPFGYVAVDGPTLLAGGEVAVDEDDEATTLTAHGIAVTIDRARGVIEQITSPDYPDGILAEPLLAFAMTGDGEVDRFDREAWVECDGDVVTVAREGRAGMLQIEIEIAAGPPRVLVTVRAEGLERPDGGMHAGLRLDVAPAVRPLRLRTDSPYALHDVTAERDFERKYPTGDWMTSAQVFETVRRPFTASSLVDLCDRDDRGLLVLHDGSQQWFRDGDRIANLLTMYDPWDEDHWIDVVHAQLAFVPHGTITDRRRWQLAQEHRNPLIVEGGPDEPGDAPPAFAPVVVHAEHTAATALYRESAFAARGFDGHFARGVRNPFVVRLVELDGAGDEVRLVVPGAIARAARTDLCGEVTVELEAAPAEPPPGLPAIAWSQVNVTLRPREIATVMLDLELGRHTPRNLDDHRHVWATVHRR